MENENKVVETKKTEKKKDGNKKPNFFKRIWIKIKEVFSELKKVTWPTFGKVVKQTGVVIAVVLVFLVAITLMDLGLTAILDKLVIG
ncbi:MAG: preprotein translocase subunit SecE [Clostridia bacterium]|nr:preprotein translocase subunit SecE [Clostridia bacterium]